MERSGRSAWDKFIIEWNEKYPFDRFIRAKYGIPFGSKKHRQMSHIDMAIEFREDTLLRKIAEENNDLDESMEAGDEKTEGDENQQKLKIIKPTQTEILEDFDNLNLNDYV